MNWSRIIKISIVVIYIIIQFTEFLFSQQPINTIEHKVTHQNLAPEKLFYINLYNFSFEKARSIIHKSKTHSSFGLFQTNLLKAKLLWWQVLSGEDIKFNIEKCERLIDKNINLYSENNISNDTQIYLIFLQSSLMKLRIANYKKQKITGLNKLITLRKEINNLTKNASPTQDEKLVLGIYLYFYEYVNEKYPFLNLILKDMTVGNKKSGIKYLEQCSNSHDPILKTQGNYFLYKIYSDIENNYIISLKYIKFLFNHYPENIVYQLEYYKNLIKTGDLKKSKSLKTQLLINLPHSTRLSKQQKNHFLKIIKNLKELD